MDIQIKVGDIVGYIMQDMQIRPAIVVKVKFAGNVNLQVFLDGDDQNSNDYNPNDYNRPGCTNWVQNVSYSQEKYYPSTWHLLNIN